MPRPVGLLYQALDDIERSIVDLPADLADRRLRGQSSIAWTAAHVTQMLDSWIVARFAGGARDPLLARRAWATGEEGAASAWDSIRTAIAAVHKSARVYCDRLSEADLSSTVPYDGSIDYLHDTGLNLEYALMRVAAHHFVHAGEIAAIRSMMGLPVEDSRQWGRQILWPRR